MSIEKLWDMHRLMQYEFRYKKDIFPSDALKKELESMAHRSWKKALKVFTDNSPDGKKDSCDFDTFLKKYKEYGSVNEQIRSFENAILNMYDFRDRILWTREFTSADSAGRVDMLIVDKDKKFHAVEIKSDKDSFARIKNQVSFMTLSFDASYVAVGEKFRKKAMKELPASVGIILIEENNGRYEAMKLRGPVATQYPSLYRFLWRTELERIAKKKTYKDELLDYLASTMTLAELVDASRDQIVRRLEEKKR